MASWQRRWMVSEKWLFFRMKWFRNNLNEHWAVRERERSWSLGYLRASWRNLMFFFAESWKRLCKERSSIFSNTWTNICTRNVRADEVNSMKLKFYNDLLFTLLSPDECLPWRSSRRWNWTTTTPREWNRSSPIVSRWGTKDLWSDPKCDIEEKSKCSAKVNRGETNGGSSHLKSTIVRGKALENESVVRIVALLMQGTMHRDVNDFSFLDFTQIQFVKFLHRVITILEREREREREWRLTGISSFVRDWWGEWRRYFVEHRCSYVVVWPTVEFAHRLVLRAVSAWFSSLLEAFARRSRRSTIVLVLSPVGNLPDRRWEDSPAEHSCPSPNCDRLFSTVRCARVRRRPVISWCRCSSSWWWSPSWTGRVWTTGGESSRPCEAAGEGLSVPPACLCEGEIRRSSREEEALRDASRSVRRRSTALERDRRSAWNWSDERRRDNRWRSTDCPRLSSRPRREDERWIARGTLPGERIPLPGRCSREEGTRAARVRREDCRWTRPWTREECRCTVERERCSSMLARSSDRDSRSPWGSNRDSSHSADSIVLEDDVSTPAENCPKPKQRPDEAPEERTTNLRRRTMKRRTKDRSITHSRRLRSVVRRYLLSPLDYHRWISLVCFSSPPAVVPSPLRWPVRRVRVVYSSATVDLHLPRLPKRCSVLQPWWFLFVCLCRRNREGNRVRRRRIRADNSFDPIWCRVVSPVSWSVPLRLDYLRSTPDDDVPSLPERRERCGETARREVTHLFIDGQFRWLIVSLSLLLLDRLFLFHRRCERVDRHWNLKWRVNFSGRINVVSLSVLDAKHFVSLWAISSPIVGVVYARNSSRRETNSFSTRRNSQPSLSAGRDRRHWSVEPLGPSLDGSGDDAI